MKKFKLHHGNESISWINYSDHPKLPKRKQGLNYVRKYKNHISIQFCNMMNDRSIIEGYNDEINAYKDYLNKLGIKYDLSSIFHKTHKCEMTTIKVKLENVDIV
jgi:hypothetical protein